jgi:predicted dehydrogenase
LERASKVQHDKPFGIGIVGTGMVAATHGRALTDLKDRVSVRGVFSPNAERRTAFATQFSWPTADSFEAILDDPTVDAVLVLTPPDTRAELVTAAARRGKHVLTEKPLGRDAAEARGIVEACEAAGVTLGVVFQNRFRAASEALRRLIAENALGPVVAVRIAVPWWRPQSYYDQPGRGTYARDGGGVLINQAIHTLDLTLSFTGPVAEVSAIAGTTALHRMEAEDFVAGGLRFANGAMGALVATTAAYPGGTESIAIDFEKAAALLEGGVLTLTRHDGSIESVGDASGTGGGSDPMAFPHDWHRDLIADFVDAVRAGRAPRVTGRTALQVHELIDALVRSASERRAVALG